jgi:hypothetical protein
LPITLPYLITDLCIKVGYVVCTYSDIFFLLVLSPIVIQANSLLSSASALYCKFISPTSAEEGLSSKTRSGIETPKECIKAITALP